MASPTNLKERVSGSGPKDAAFLEEENGRLWRALHKLQTASQQACDEITILKETNAKLEQERDLAREENRTLHSRNEELGKKFTQKESILQRMSAAIKRAIKEFHDLKQKYEEVLTENEALQNQYALACERLRVYDEVMHMYPGGAPKENTTSPKAPPSKSLPKTPPAKGALQQQGAEAADSKMDINRGGSRGQSLDKREAAAIQKDLRHNVAELEQIQSRSPGSSAGRRTPSHEGQHRPISILEKDLNETIKKIHSVTTPQKPLPPRIARVFHPTQQHPSLNPNRSSIVEITELMKESGNPVDIDSPPPAPQNLSDRPDSKSQARAANPVVPQPQTFEPPELKNYNPETIRNMFVDLENELLADMNMEQRPQGNRV